MSVHELSDKILDTPVSWEDVEHRLRTALKTKASLQLQEMVEIGKGIGLCSRCVLVNCDWTGVGENELLPSQILIKIPTSAPFRAVQASLEKDKRTIDGDDDFWKKQEETLRTMHDTEVAMYQWLQGSEGFAIPRMFYGMKNNPEGKLNGQLCLSYVANSRTMTSSENYTVQLMRQIAQELGKIQAYSFKNQMDVPDLSRNLSAGFTKHITPEAFSHVHNVDCERAMELWALIEEFLPEYYGSTITKTIHTQMGLTPVLVHGDMKTENVLIDKDSEELAAVVDWQCSHLGVGVEDLLRMTLSALSKEERRESASMLIEEMYDSFLEHLNGSEPPYSLDTVKTVYNILLPHCAFLLVRLGVLHLNKIANNATLSDEEKTNRRGVLLGKVVGMMEDILQYHEKNKELVTELNLKFRYP